MASQVLSGAANVNYTNNTGQNVRLIINYMANVTSMTWAGVNVTAESTTIGKDIQNITGEFRGAELGPILETTPQSNTSTPTSGGGVQIREMIVGKKQYLYHRPGSGLLFPTPFRRFLDVFNGPKAFGNDDQLNQPSGTPFVLMAARERSESDIGFNVFYVPLTVSRGGKFPVEIMLAPNQGYSAICGAFNIVAIKEDGT